jgi:hypothetical protein
MKEQDYQNFSEGLNYGYLFFGVGSLIALVGSLIYNIPILSVFSTAVLWATFYFLPYYNEIRSRIKYGKQTEEVKKMLVLSVVGIDFVGILAYCFFLLDYKLYDKNQKLILVLYTIVVLVMLVNAVIKLLEIIKELKYKSEFRKKAVISILLIVIQFVLFYPIYDYIKVKPTYSLPSIKVADGVKVSEVNLFKDNKNPVIANINELPSYISEAISNKPSKDLAFLQSLRIELEEQREIFYEVFFDYKLKENNKAENEVYASSLIIFKDKPIVILTLKSNDTSLNKLSEYKYKIQIELSEDEYKKVRDYIADFSKVKR